MRAPSRAVRSKCGSVKKCRRLAPSMVRREEPSASSSAEFAKTTMPSPRTTATRVASRSKDWKRWAGEAGGFKPSFCGRAGRVRRGGRAAGAREFAPQAGDVLLVAVDGGLEFGHAIEVLLVVLALGALLFRLAVVVFLQQVGAAGLGLLQFGLEDAACFGVTRLLLGIAHALFAAAGRRCGHDLAFGIGAIHLRALHHRDVAALDGLAALGLCLGLVVGI